VAACGDKNNVTETQAMKAMMRGIAALAGTLLLVWVGCAGFLYWAMRQPPEEFGRVMKHMPGPGFMAFPFETMWTSARGGSLRVGENAPNFQVQTLDTKAPVQLESLWGTKPVVLVFGSFTCPPYRREAPELNKLAEQYKGKVAFYSVYIQEAHPTDLWAMQQNVRDKVLFSTPKSEDQRFAVAGECVRRLGINFPALVDGLDNHTEIAYTAWPDRMFLIAPGGKLLYKSRPGPFGFDPDDLAAALKKNVL
jgi:thiol-disulfide isomerase/thioredoxin